MQASCGSCGSMLTIKSVDSDHDPVVEPCEKCMNETHIDGFTEGREEGHTAGYSEGYEIGKSDGTVNS